MSRAEATFYEAFDGLARLAPGSAASTARALQVVRQQMEPRRILDIGCGSGAQTLVLAKETRAEIVAVDSHAPYLRALEARAEAAGFCARVRTLEASMAELGTRLSGETFDLIWSEGSIYVIGFDAGLRAWRGLLGEGGVLACTEASWLVDRPSDAARRFWGEAYPAMRSVEANLADAHTQGYETIGHFALPASDWVDEYYGPLDTRVGRLREKYAGDAEASGVLDVIQAEIDLYRRASGEYGYVFYVLRPRIA